MPDPDAATAAAMALMKDELSECEDCGCRQMAKHLGALVVQKVRPLIVDERIEAAEAVALQAEHYVRDEVPSLIAEARAEERQRIRQRLLAHEAVCAWSADHLLDGDGDAR